jgi:hypothetical protein
MAFDKYYSKNVHWLKIPNLGKFYKKAFLKTHQKSNKAKLGSPLIKMRKLVIEWLAEQ